MLCLDSKKTTKEKNRKRNIATKEIPNDIDTDLSIMNNVNKIKMKKKTQKS